MLTPEKIEWVDINSLKPHPKNPNKHSEEQIERLSRIIQYQGFRIPITVISDTDVIAAGHGRLLAAKKAGLTTVPIIRQDFIDDEQLFAFIVSDNSIAAWAELDFGLINLEIENLGPDFDIELLGLKNFSLDYQVKEINQGDENSEWVDMPEFEANEEGYIRLSYLFKTNEARDSFVNTNDITVDKKLKNVWIIYKT